MNGLQTPRKQGQIANRAIDFMGALRHTSRMRCVADAGPRSRSSRLR